MIDSKLTPVSWATRLSWRMTPGMSAVFGIARESLKRSATRIGGGPDAVLTPWASAIFDCVSSICCFRSDTS